MKKKILLLWLFFIPVMIAFTQAQVDSNAYQRKTVQAFLKKQLTKTAFNELDFTKLSIHRRLKGKIYYAKVAYRDALYPAFMVVRMEGTRQEYVKVFSYQYRLDSMLYPINTAWSLTSNTKRLNRVFLLRHSGSVAKVFVNGRDIKDTITKPTCFICMPLSEKALGSIPLISMSLLFDESINGRPGMYNQTLVHLIPLAFVDFPAIELEYYFDP